LIRLVQAAPQRAGLLVERDSLAQLFHVKHRKDGRPESSVSIVDAGVDHALEEVSVDRSTSADAAR